MRGGGGGAKLFRGASRRARGLNFKNSKNPYMKQRKFEHSSSIIKCFKIGGTHSTFGGFKAPKGGWGPDFKDLKKPHTEWSS